MKRDSQSTSPAKDLLPKVHLKKEKSVEHEESEIHSVFLEAALPAETHLVVSEAECRAEAVPASQLDLDETEYEASPVVLSGKMTLSVIGMDLVADHPVVATEEVVAERKSSLKEHDTFKTHRVRFVPEPQEVIIPVDLEDAEEECAVPECCTDEVEGEELVEPPISPYRPPTPRR
jgi:hypothetical protein